jgi:hypothetical protein
MVWHQVVAGWPSHVASWPGGAASTDFLHRLGLLLLVWTRVLEAVGQTGIKRGRLGPFGLGFGPLSPCVKYTAVVMMILTFGQFYFVIP